MPQVTSVSQRVSLLSPAERTVLFRLSVFADGWTQEAAVAICTGSSREATEAARILTLLREKSLVLDISESQEGRKRQGVASEVRRFALRTLRANDEYEEVATRHARYYLQLAQQAASRRDRHDPGWIDVLEAEYANLRAALTWCLAHPDALEIGLQLVGAIGAFWNYSYRKEGRRYIQKLLARDAPSKRSAARASALNAAGDLARYQGSRPAGPIMKRAWRSCKRSKTGLASRRHWKA
jgi:predicted ATPase